MCDLLRYQDIDKLFRTSETSIANEYLADGWILLYVQEYFDHETVYVLGRKRESA